MPPLLTAVSLVGPMRNRAARMLQTLIDLSSIDQMEILIIEFEPDQFAPLPGYDHPAVQVIRMDESTTYGDARAFAVRTAQSPIVAFIEEHAFVHPGWADALIRAHKDDWAGVGGEIQIATQNNAVSKAVMFTNYRTALPPATRGPVPSIPGHNSSYKRDLLLNYDDELERYLGSEILLQWKLQADGYQVFLEPDARFTHLNETRISSIMRGFFIINRSFAANRVEDWGLLRRLSFIAFAPINPFTRTLRTFIDIYQHRRSYFPKLVRNLPVVFLTHLCSVAGHTVGLVFGKGQSDYNFRVYEISEPRDDVAGALADVG